MTPVHPIDTSGATRDRRTTSGRRAPTFKLPADGPAASDLAIRSTPTVANPAAVMLSADDSADVPAADQASQTFVDNVARVMRTPHRITGWFVDLIV